MKKPKKVEQMKTETLGPEKPKTNNIQVVPGNTAILTVQFLDAILKQLSTIRALLENKNG